MAETKRVIVKKVARAFMAVRTLYVPIGSLSFMSKYPVM